MALGAVKGIWTFGANSIVANNQATLLSGSAVVARGDLIVVVIGEVVANTSTGASDTLGNTYTAATAGTLGGGVSGRAFYSIVTTGGTNTNINVAATASVNNVAIVAACFEGSFSAVDKTPANNNNTDNASPFVCPSTTTLSQALEVVIGWMVDNTANAKAATSPNILVNQRNQTTISTVMGSQRVNVTTAVTPNFTGTNPTGSQQGTLSFRAASLPVGTGPLLPNRSFPYQYPIQLRTWTQSPQVPEPEAAGLPFNEYAWPLPRAHIQPALPAIEFLQPVNVLTVHYVSRAPTYTNPRAHPYHVQLRSFFGRLPPPLRLPDGEIFTELTQRPYPYPNQHRTWTWNYNLNLIGKDRFPAGEVVTERPALRPVQAANWIDSVNLALTGVVPSPFNQLDWPLTQATIRSTETWISQTKLLLAVPLNQAEWPLPRQLARERTWVQPYNLALNTPTVEAAPFVQHNWYVTFAPTPIPQSITASYNPNLVGQDRLPNRQMDWPVPRAHHRQPDLASWIDRVKLLLAVPFNQDDWPINRGPLQPNRSYGQVFPRVLIGQDLFPPGTDLTDLPPRDYQRASQLRTWIDNVSLALVTTPPVKPFNQQDWPLTPAAKQPTTIFAATYNKNLVGQDRLPNRQQDWPNPKPRARDAITWFDRHKSYLQRPFRQLDWPTPKGHQQPALSYTASVNLPLATFVAPKPFNQYDWRVTPDNRRLSAWLNATNPNLYPVPPLAAMPFSQLDWRLPQQPAPPWQRYSYEFQGGNLYPIQDVNPIPPPPPPTPPTDVRARGVPGSEWQYYDRLRDWPGPLGWR